MKIFKSITVFMLESMLLQPEKANVIRMISALLRANKGSPSDIMVIEGVVMGYFKHLITKVSTEVENLGKENIESAVLKSANIQKTLYKLNKFEVKCPTNDIKESLKVITEAFNKVTKKEDMAKNVLTHEILAKFKTLKENLLKSVVLSHNLLGDESQAEL